MQRWPLFFTVAMLTYVLQAPTWAQQDGQSGITSNGAEMQEIPLVSSDGTDVVIDPGWSIPRRTTIIATIEVVQEGVKAGRYCLRIATTKGENSWDAQLIHKGHVFRKGKVYTLAAYLRSPDKLQINFGLQLAEDPWTWYGGQSFTMADTWQEYHVTTPPMLEDVSPARINFDFAYDTGEFYIDSVRFYEGEYVPYEPEGMGQIEGRLLMLDDETPHVAVPVQLMRNGEVITTTLSDERGRYRFVILKPGKYQLRCQVLDGYVYYRAAGDALRVTRNEEDASGEVIQFEGGKTSEVMNFRFAPFKRGTWRTYNFLDGLAGNWVTAIYGDPDGVMWFGTNGGLSRYDGQKFTNFTTKDGLPDNWVNSIYRDHDGVMWLGTQNGLSRYDGRGMSSFLEKSLSKKGEYGGRPSPVGDFPHFRNFTTEDGLVNNYINAIDGTPDGTIWFATGTYGIPGRGISRCDGMDTEGNPHFVSFTEQNGLPGDDVINDVHVDTDGAVLFATWGGGVLRYDGQEFRSLEDGLASRSLFCVHSDLDGGIWVGTYLKGVSWYNGKETVTFTTRDGLADKSVYRSHSDADGVMWFGTEGGLSRYDGRTFVNFTQKDGLASNIVYSIHRAPDGSLWVGTAGGVCRYDERGLQNLTTRDGLVHNYVNVICEDSNGNLWFGTEGGVSQYDVRGMSSFLEKSLSKKGEYGGRPSPVGDFPHFRNFATKDAISSIHCSADGTLWFGSFEGGVFRYDGKKLAPIREGGIHIMSIQSAPDGTIWFGSGGIRRYDGKEFVEALSTEDGLPSNAVNAIHRTPDDTMWVAMWDIGAARYDGQRFISYTAKDGLADDYVNCIYSTPDGMIWFGTDAGVSRHDGQKFQNFTPEDGLAGYSVTSILRDTDGIMWFGTASGGVSLYDGAVWTSIDKRDGLAGNAVWSIHQQEDGSLLFATEGGVTIYHRSTNPPSARIASVKTDREYTDLRAVPPITTGRRVTVRYGSVDFVTIPEKRLYRYRFRKGDASRVTRNENADLGWYRPTKETSFDWIPEKTGTYIFEVQAIDRDLNYSEPVSLTLKVVPPFYMKTAFLVPVAGAGLVLLLTSIISLAILTKRRRQVHAYQEAAVKELQDAREMQISLLPEAAPSVEGMKIAGRSMTANTVGGDFFDYLILPDGKVGIVIADVSGKGLRAAMNAVLASGMLYEVVKAEMSCGSILSVMNSGLYPRTEKQMFTAFSLAILDKDTIQWSNAAQPHPLIKRSDSASEAQEDGQLPLGMMPDVKYPDYELKLQSGDTLIFYTDGIIEAENADEEIYGTERLLDLIADIDSAASAEDVIEAILQDVSEFVGTAERYDDMTLVVVKKLEKSDAS